MRSEIRWSDLRAAFSNLEETQLIRLTGLMARPVGELTDDELNELLELRRLMVEHMPLLGLTIVKTRHVLHALDKRLEELQLATVPSAESEHLEQLAMRVTIARKMIQGQSDVDAEIIQLLLEEREVDALSEHGTSVGVHANE